MFGTGAKKFNGKNDDTHYGTPAPAFTWPSARINGQPADWPEGKFLPPCIVPPPTVTLVGTMLTIGGSSIDLASMLGGANIGNLSATITGPETVGMSLATKFTYTITNVGNTNQFGARVFFTFVAGVGVADDFGLAKIMGTIHLGAGVPSVPVEIPWQQARDTGLLLTDFPAGSVAILDFNAEFSFAGLRTLGVSVSLRYNQLENDPADNTDSHVLTVL